MDKSYILTHQGNGSQAGLRFSTLEEAKRAAEPGQGTLALEWAERPALPGVPRAFAATGFMIVECDAA